MTEHDDEERRRKRAELREQTIGVCERGEAILAQIHARAASVVANYTPSGAVEGYPGQLDKPERLARGPWQHPLGRQLLRSADPKK